MNIPSWQGAGSPIMGSQGLVRRGEWAIATLSRLGAPPPPGSRLPRAVAFIGRFNDDPRDLESADDGLLRRVSDAHRTIWNLFVVAYAAQHQTRTSQAWFPKTLLSEALGGNDDPASDRNPKARNTEFELYVGSVLSLSGATVTFREPDLEVLVPGRQAGVAAKRVSIPSDSALAARLTDAARQIAGSHGFGYVAINIDAYYRGDRLAGDEAARATQFDRRLERVVEAMRRSLGRRHAVKGVIAFGYMDSWDTSTVPPKHEAAFPTGFRLITDDDDNPEAVSRLNEFWSRIMRNSQSVFRSLVTGRRE